MAQRRYLKSNELEDIIENWTDDENEAIDNIVLCPPEQVDEITDEEGFDENELPNINPGAIQEVAGYVEIEYESREEDFAAPGVDSGVANNEPGPSAPKKGCNQTSYKTLE